MLINLSNHPSAKWSDEQTQAAIKQYGSVVDIPFPQVDSNGDEEYIASLAEEYVSKVLDTVADSFATVHLMGEMTLTFTLVCRLQRLGYSCVASTTERAVREFDDGSSEVQFKFVRFRTYDSVSI